MSGSLHMRETTEFHHFITSIKRCQTPLPFLLPLRFPPSNCRIPLCLAGIPPLNPPGSKVNLHCLYPQLHAPNPPQATEHMQRLPAPSSDRTSWSSSGEMTSQVVFLDQRGASARLLYVWNSMFSQVCKHRQCLFVRLFLSVHLSVCLS